MCSIEVKINLMEQTSIGIGGIPDKTVEAVREHLNRNNRNIRLDSFSKRTWSDGCLGLGKEGEFCTQALVPGWRIVLSNDKVEWVFRTDDSGQIVREESIELK